RVWQRTVAEGTGARAARKALSTGSDTTSLDREGQRRKAPTGHPDGKGPSGPDGGGAGNRADLRSRLATGTVWISAEAKPPGCRETGTPTGQHRVPRGSRC